MQGYSPLSTGHQNNPWLFDMVWQSLQMKNDTRGNQAMNDVATVTHIKSYLLPNRKGERRGANTLRAFWDFFPSHSHALLICHWIKEKCQDSDFTSFKDKFKLSLGVWCSNKQTLINWNILCTQPTWNTTDEPEVIWTFHFFICFKLV